MMIRYLTRHSEVRIVDQPLAGFRLHSSSKTVSQSDRFDEEQHQTLLRYSTDGPSELRKVAAAHLERLKWWAELEQIEDATSNGNRIAGAVRIVSGVLSRPATRAGLASIKALFRVLASGR
jgi:hypothetical protein